MEYKYYNNVAVMVVKIDFSNLPIHLRNAITSEIGMKKRSGEGRSNGDTDKENIEKSTGNKIKDEEDVLEENDAYYTRQRLNDSLIKNRIHNYVAVLHPKAGKSSYCKGNQCRATGYTPL
jgi:hypothetical protein